jgi:hypothetical protein
VPASINCGAPVWIDFVGMTGQNPMRSYEIGTRVLNLGTAAANQVASGVFPGGGSMLVTAGSGMQVQVAAGYCCVANSSSSLQGGYVFGTMTQVTLSIAAADPVNPRIDIVIARVYDNGNSTSFCDVEMVTGTPGASPSAPAAPANSVVLAQVAVAAGAASIVAGNVTDERAYVVAPGGVLPIASAASAPAVPASQIMYDIATNQLVQGTGSAGSVAVVGGLPWAPQMSTVTANVTDSGFQGQLTSITALSVTTDGSTDIDIYAKWAGWEVGTQPLAVTLFIQIDGVTVDQTDLYIQNTSIPMSGGSVHYYTSSAQSNTPSAGTHAINWAFQSASSSITTTLVASATAVAQLRCSPAVV